LTTRLPRAEARQAQPASLIVINLMLAFALAGCSMKSPTLADGLLAYNHNQVAEAEAIFRQVADNPRSSPHDRATARRALARIAWLIDGNKQRAIEALDSAAAAGEPCDAARMRARVLDEAGDARELVSQSGPWITLCKDSEARDEIRYYTADSLLSAADRSPSRDALLARASDVLAAITRDQRTDLHVATARLELALMTGNPAGAIDAWKDYFWLTNADGPQVLAALDPHPAERFTKALLPGATTHDQLLLIDLLTRAGFARQAERLAGRWNLAARGGSDPLWRKASAYLAERRKLEAILLASNRRVARGGRASNLRTAVHSAETALAAAADIKSDLRSGLAKAYGLYGTVGRTGGFESVHLGHLVQSERLPVDQYGRRAEVAYFVVDNMISNGYESWLWDGDAADGGWTEKGPIIVQARPGYTQAPLKAWLLVANAEHRREYLERSSRLEADDKAVLRTAAVAYLPGLAHRLNLQVAEQILARARVIAGSGGDLHRAFLAEYSRANLQQSIFIHEGRHALDLHFVPGDSLAHRAALEYRAKLSELALSDYPRLALFNIDGATIGGSNEHGIANRRIMAEYASWVRAHAGEVKGYDPGVPPVEQLDRLRDDQIRAVARTLDPFARVPVARR
jgi:hypothetical protein